MNPTLSRRLRRYWFPGAVILAICVLLLVRIPASAQTGLDQDGDGMPDAWETANGLNPRIGVGVNGANGDPDHDGLPNGDEWANQTDPNRADTDGDGLPDLWEVENGTDPLQGDGVNGANGDADGDGLLNKDEMVRGADPQNWDTDSDTLPDGWEVAEGLKPNDNRGQNGANGLAAGGRESNHDKFDRLNEDFSPPIPSNARR